MLAPKHKALTYEQIKNIIEETDNPMVKAMIATQYGLGCRAGELVNYIHNNFVGAKDPIFETKGLLKSNISKQKGTLFFDIPNFKNGTITRKMPYILPEEKFVYDPIVAWLDQCNEQVFPISESYYRRLVRKALPEGFASHSLRHSRATHLTARGFSVPELMSFLGHSEPSTSLVYISQDLGRTIGKLRKSLQEES